MPGFQSRQMGGRRMGGRPQMGMGGQPGGGMQRAPRPSPNKMLLNQMANRNMDTGPEGGGSIRPRPPMRRGGMNRPMGGMRRGRR